MRWRRIIIALLALVAGGWLLFDGLHAFVTGDYVTPSSGAYAGQLGPWSALVSAVGIPPRSPLMMGIHVGVGGAWVISIAAFLAARPWARRAMIFSAVAALWHVPFTTLICVMQLLLLNLGSGRRL